MENLKLEYFSYTSGGGMRGGKSDFCMYVKDGKTVIAIEDTPYYEIPPKKERYVLPPSAMDAMTDIALSHETYKWKNLPKSDILVLDAPSVSVSLRFSDGTRIYYDHDSILPEYGVTDDFIKCMFDSRKNENTPCMLSSFECSSDGSGLCAENASLKNGFLTVELRCEKDGECIEYCGSYKVFSEGGELLYEFEYEDEPYHKYFVRDRFGIPVTIDLNPCGLLCGTYVIEIMGMRLRVGTGR